MDDRRLVQVYGKNWHLDPPSQSRVVIGEGRLDLANFNANTPMVVCQYLSSNTSEGTVLVIQFVETKYFQFSDDGVYTELPSMAMVGRYTWALQIAAANLQHNSQFPMNDGYFDNVANPLPRNVLEGVSEARRLHFSYSPIIVPPGNDFRIILRPQVAANGTPKPDDQKQAFSAIFTGFSLPLV